MAERATCTWCGKDGIAVRKDGALWRHWDAQRNETCKQWSAAAMPWPTAWYRIEQQAEEPDSPTVELLAAMDDPAPLSDADAFLFHDPEPTQARRTTVNKRGYFAKDPDLGDFRRFKNGKIRPFTRVSTFVKAGSDRTALTDWNERNVLLGAAHFPEIAARARELHPNPEGPLPEDKGTKAELDRIVDDLAERVGSKRAANRGTAIHNSIEKVAKGLVPVERMDDMLPTDHVPWVEAFLTCLEENNFELMPDMVECTVFVSEFGGVMGRFDQAVRERLPNGERIPRMTDVKTGRLDYSFDEIEGQLSLYQRGYMQHGHYEWHPTDESGDRWVPPRYAIADDYGVVFHLPVKEGIPICYAVKVDLKRGWAHVEDCGRLRAKVKPKPEVWTPTIVEPEDSCVYGCHADGLNYQECSLHGEGTPAEPELIDWSPRFANAQSKLELSGLYKSVVSAGVDRMEIQRLVGLGKARLAALANGSVSRVDAGSVEQ